MNCCFFFCQLTFIFFLLFLDVIKELAGQCVDGAKVLDLCVFGDQKLAEATSKIYRKDKDVKKGVMMMIIIFFYNLLDE